MDQKELEKDWRSICFDCGSDKDLEIISDEVALCSACIVKNVREMDDRAIVRSSNGDIYINFITGAVEHIDTFPECQLPSITKFELPDEKASEYDILELGFWLEDGYYVTPDYDFINRERF